MGLQGHFEWYNSPRLGGRRAISFILTCNNLFQDETFDCAIIDKKGLTQRMIFRQVQLKAKQSVSFNFDTIDWQWQNGDIFVILGKKDSIKDSWSLNLKVYAPGECPECHGTEKCRKCSGKGYITHRYSLFEPCDICFLSGICQTCYVPQRDISTAPLPNQLGNNQNCNSSVREREIQNLRRRIEELKRSIEKQEWDMRIWQLRDMDITNSFVYLSNNRNLHQDKIELIKLQSKLDQLESMR